MTRGQYMQLLLHALWLLESFHDDVPDGSRGSNWVEAWELAYALRYVGIA